MHRIVRCIIALAILVGSYGQTVAQHPLAGARVFGAKGCVKCHAVNGVGGTLGPDLGHNPLSHSFSDFAAAMWHHLPQMAAHMRQIEVPRLHLDPWETGDLMAFLQGLGEGQE